MSGGLSQIGRDHMYGCYGAAKARIPLRELPLIMILAPKKQHKLNDIDY